MRLLFDLADTFLLTTAGQHSTNEDCDDKIEDEETLRSILHNHPDWRDIARSIAQLIYCMWFLADQRTIDGCDLLELHTVHDVMMLS